ncbi:hypothetical protein IWQ62_000489 [Dispira parvispora]|uniref:Uncharacterized protein n=1 Tax=Dispira parvispora TaxID=1520584 RepID=A0A9W8AWX5_9FUNG|nr:hypothetical protein IWQ62_000489 [Dispira parvispora]
MSSVNPIDGDDQITACWGCKKQIEEGSVVSFGDGIWHIDWDLLFIHNVHISED